MSDDISEDAAESHARQHAAEGLAPRVEGMKMCSGHLFHDWEGPGFQTGPTNSGKCREFWRCRRCGKMTWSGDSWPTAATPEEYWRGQPQVHEVDTP